MIKAYRSQPFIKGFTTNPTLMPRRASPTTRIPARILAAIPDRPISLEVFSDELAEMQAQALRIASWGSNVYVKIPITNTRRQSALPLVRKLASEGMKLNVTALLTLSEVPDVVGHLNPEGPPSFGVRRSDRGHGDRSGAGHGGERELASMNPMAEVIWASPRELLNIYQADAVGCQVITVSGDVLKKVALIGRDLDEYSLDTVKMFYADATRRASRSEGWKCTPVLLRHKRHAARP